MINKLIIIIFKQYLKNKLIIINNNYSKNKI